MDQHERTKRLLGAVQSGTQQHAVALASRKQRPTKRPMKPKARTEGPAEWGEQLRAAIKDGLESVWQPTITKKDLALLKRLVAGFPAGMTPREFFAWLCDRNRWPRIRKQVRLHPEAMSTVSVIWVNQHALIPAYLKDRSLQASPTEDSSTDPAVLDFVHSYR
jgi:hypothetical protein